MRKTLVILAAVALTACGRTETDSYGEVVVDTLNTPNIDATLGTPGDSIGTDTLGTDTLPMSVDSRSENVSAQPAVPQLKLVFAMVHVVWLSTQGCSTR